MDPISIARLTQAQPTEAAAPVEARDDSFKFILASNIGESELQEKLTSLMSEITSQGERLSKRKDIRDMKRYRGLSFFPKRTTYRRY